MISNFHEYLGTVIDSLLVRYELHDYTDLLEKLEEIKDIIEDHMEESDV